MTQKKLLFITRNFPPLVGGMERLAFELIRNISSTYTCTVVGPGGAGKAVSAGIATFECPVNPVPLFLISSLIQSIRASYKKKPDIVVAGSGATAPMARVAAGIARCPYAVIVHGLDLIVRNKIYQRVFVPSITAADLVISNSQNTRQIAIKCGVPESKIRVINPGVDEPLKSDFDFRSQHNLGERPVILFLGRLVPRKGLTEFVTHSLPDIVKRIPDVVLLVVGAEPENALFHKGGVLSKLQEVIEKLGLTDNFIYAGRLTDDIVEAVYSAANVFIFPVINTPGDVEGFGMVALEAAIHGVPTVAFNTDGIPDAVSDGHTGHLIEPGDYGTMAERICDLIEHRTDNPINAEYCIEFARRFSWSRYAEETRNVLEGITGAC